MKGFSGVVLVFAEDASEIAAVHSGLAGGFAHIATGAFEHRFHIFSVPFFRSLFPFPFSVPFFRSIVTPDFDTSKNKVLQFQQVKGARLVCASRICLFLQGKDFGWRLESDGGKQFKGVAFDICADPYCGLLHFYRYGSDL